MKMATAAGFLAFAFTIYILVGPEDGMISGPGTVSSLLKSAPIINL